MNEVIPDPTKAQVAALDRLARSLGVNAEDRELFLTDRPAWEAKVRGERAQPQAASAATGSMSLGARPAAMPPTNLDDALGRDRMRAAMGIEAADFASFRASQLQLARDRSRRGETLTYTMAALIDAEEATATPIVPTAEERATYERSRRPAGDTFAALEQILRTTPPRPAPGGRTGAMKMVSSALVDPGTR
jgi:hypothetical protein